MRKRIPKERDAKGRPTRKPVFNPDHPLWEEFHTRISAGMVTCVALAEEARARGHSLTHWQIRQGLRRYGGLSLAFQAFPWLIEAAHNAAKELEDWQDRMAGGIKQKEQIIGLMLEQLRTMPRGRLEERRRLMVSIGHELEAHNAMVIDWAIILLKYRRALPPEERPKLPAGLPPMQNYDLLREELLRARREMAEGYRMLLEDAVELGLPLPPPKPLEAEWSEVAEDGEGSQE